MPPITTLDPMPCATTRPAAPQGWERIPAQSGTAFVMQAGDLLEVRDPMGEQVADLFAVALRNHDVLYSAGRTLDYAGKLYLSVGDRLYANDSQVMFTLIEDSVGRHDTTLTPCSQRMFERLYGVTGHHPSCEENLWRALEPHGLRRSQIGTTFNIFMNVFFDAQGTMTVGCPWSRAGDHLLLRAEMDLLVGLTACSAEGSNNGHCKPIDWRLHRGR